MSLTDTLAGILRSGQADQVLGRAIAGPDAQGSADGIGIQNVRRGVMRIALSALGSAITVAVGGYASLSTPLKGDMLLSGRPLRVMLTGTVQAGSGGSLALDVRLRGASMTGVANGIHYTASTVWSGFHGEDVVMTPGAGRATIEVVAKATTATGSIAVDADNRLVLLAEEL